MTDSEGIQTRRYDDCEVAIARRSVTPVSRLFRPFALRVATLSCVEVYVFRRVSWVGSAVAYEPSIVDNDDRDHGLWALGFPGLCHVDYV
jgi:hypothetical protein